MERLSQGLNFDSLDRVEMSMYCQSVAGMDVGEVRDYFEKSYCFEFGESVPYDVRYRGVFNGFCKHFKRDAGRIVKWVFFAYGGVVFGERVTPMFFASYNREVHNRLLDELRAYRGSQTVSSYLQGSR